jgi:hypothetical protein
MIGLKLMREIFVKIASPAVLDFLNSGRFNDFSLRALCACDFPAVKALVRIGGTCRIRIRRTVYIIPAIH